MRLMYLCSFRNVLFAMKRVFTIWLHGYDHQHSIGSDYEICLKQHSFNALRSTSAGIPKTMLPQHGSKMNEGVGCAVVIQGEIFIFSLNKNVSFYIAELPAIHPALHSEFHSSYARPLDSIFYTARLMPDRPAVFYLSTLVYGSRGGSTWENKDKLCCCYAGNRTVWYTQFHKWLPEVNKQKFTHSQATSRGSDRRGGGRGRVCSLM